jgi:hypothetical protein
MGARSSQIRRCIPSASCMRTYVLDRSSYLTAMIDKGLLRSWLGSKTSNVTKAGHNAKGTMCQTRICVGTQPVKVSILVTTNEMRHDIYSLGVCLLEIRLWGSFVQYDCDT